MVNLSSLRLGLIFGVFLSFRCKESMTEVQFQDYALKVLQQNFPEQKFQKSEDAKTIKTENMEINLHNLYRKYQLGNTSIEAEILNAHGGTDENKVFNKPITWQEAKQKLRPKMNPKRNLEAAPKLLHRVLTADLILTYVIDLGNFDQYLTTDIVSEWGKSEQEIQKHSFRNLEILSQKIVLETVGNDIITLTTNDTYDSARILLPELQEKIQEKLGPDFRIGLPNRDFLIFWSKRLDKNGVAKIEQQISDDFEKMPYSLSNKTFILKNRNLYELKL